jgi:hypothetical protein
MLLFCSLVFGLRPEHRGGFLGEKVSASSCL